jgi:hypothetical protein
MKSPRRGSTCQRAWRSPRVDPHRHTAGTHEQLRHPPPGARRLTGASLYPLKLQPSPVPRNDQRASGKDAGRACRPRHSCRGEGRGATKKITSPELDEGLSLSKDAPSLCSSPSRFRRPSGHAPAARGRRDRCRDRLNRDGSHGIGAGSPRSRGKHRAAAGAAKRSRDRPRRWRANKGSCRRPGSRAETGKVDCGIAD